MSSGPALILLHIVVIVVAAKLGGAAAQRLKQPAVLGELLVGVLLGAGLLGGFIGMPDFHLHERSQDALEAEPADDAALGRFYAEEAGALSELDVLSLLATLGVILLLFEVGLESDLRGFAKVGGSSLLVAVIGVAVSFAFGFAFSWSLARMWAPWQAVDASLEANLLHVFVGATLTATSVGITARVLADLGRLKSAEARIILGAAVLDDIGGLLILAVVAAMAAAASSAAAAVGALDILWIAAKAIGFLALALGIGLKVVPAAFDASIRRIRMPGFSAALAFAFALLMGFLATLAGLADIVGAFAGGLILSQSRDRHRIFEDLRPLAAILVPFFFVTLGMRVDLTRMEGHAGAVLAIGLALAAVAIAAKLACGLGVVGGVASRWVVGVGMAPRGEVGLIFAALGLSSGLLAIWQYTALVLVVLVTTFVTPIWLARLQGSFKGTIAAGPAGGDMTRILEP